MFLYYDHKYECYYKTLYKNQFLIQYIHPLIHYTSISNLCPKTRHVNHFPRINCNCLRILPQDTIAIEHRKRQGSDICEDKAKQAGSSVGQTVSVFLMDIAAYPSVVGRGHLLRTVRQNRNTEGGNAGSQGRIL